MFNLANLFVILLVGMCASENCVPLAPYQTESGLVTNNGANGVQFDVTSKSGCVVIKRFWTMIRCPTDVAVYMNPNLGAVTSTPNVVGFERIANTTITAGSTTNLTLVPVTLNVTIKVNETRSFVVLTRCIRYANNLALNTLIAEDDWIQVRGGRGLSGNSFLPSLTVLGGGTVFNNRGARIRVEYSSGKVVTTNPSSAPSSSPTFPTSTPTMSPTSAPTPLAVILNERETCRGFAPKQTQSATKTHLRSAGAQFDITATTGCVVVQRLWSIFHCSPSRVAIFMNPNLGDVNSTRDVFGFERIGNVTIANVSSTTALTLIPITLNVLLKPGETRSFAIVTDSRCMKYQTEAGLTSVLAQDDFVWVQGGRGLENIHTPDNSTLGNGGVVDGRGMRIRVEYLSGAVWTKNPTSTPSTTPSGVPSHSPSTTPTAMPTFPTATPSFSPTLSPSTPPSTNPSTLPSSNPTPTPTSGPTTNPTTVPSSVPTNSPTLAPSTNPSAAPSSSPTNLPSVSPTGIPTDSPTAPPSFAPSGSPSSVPSHVPSVSPTTAPTGVPTRYPTSGPTRRWFVNQTRSFQLNVTLINDVVSASELIATASRQREINTAMYNAAQDAMRNQSLKVPTLNNVRFGVTTVAGTRRKLPPRYVMNVSIRVTAVEYAWAERLRNSSEMMVSRFLVRLRMAWNDSSMVIQKTGVSEITIDAQAATIATSSPKRQDSLSGPLLVIIIPTTLAVLFTISNFIYLSLSKQSKSLQVKELVVWILLICNTYTGIAFAWFLESFNTALFAVSVIFLVIPFVSSMIAFYRFTLSMRENEEFQIYIEKNKYWFVIISFFCGSTFNACYLANSNAFGLDAFAMNEVGSVVTRFWYAVVFEDFGIVGVWIAYLVLGGSWNGVVVCVLVTSVMSVAIEIVNFAGKSDTEIKDVHEATKTSVGQVNILRQNSEDTSIGEEMTAMSSTQKSEAELADFQR